MKRYLVFYYRAYYPIGGMEDFFGDYDELDIATVHILQHITNNMDYETLLEELEYQQFHIFDTTERKIVATQNDFKK